VYLREFDSNSSVLYAFEKTLGDGSAGFYAEYRLNRMTFVPQLVVAISKTDADHRNGYNFVRGKRPNGDGWQRTLGGPSNHGCLIETAELNRIAVGGAVGCP